MLDYFWNRHEPIGIVFSNRIVNLCGIVFSPTNRIVIIVISPIPSRIVILLKSLSSSKSHSVIPWSNRIFPNRIFWSDHEIVTFMKIPFCENSCRSPKSQKYVDGNKSDKFMKSRKSAKSRKSHNRRIWSESRKSEKMQNICANPFLPPNFWFFCGFRGKTTGLIVTQEETWGLLLRHLYAST